MYRIHKEAWFFTNPRDYLAGAPSDKCENRNECIILDYNTILDKKDVNWNHFIYFQRTNSIKKEDIERALNALPYDIPYELREKSYKYLLGFEDKDEFDKIKDKMSFEESDTFAKKAIKMKRYELLLPAYTLLADKHSIRSKVDKSELTPTGNDIRTVLQNFGFNIHLESSDYRNGGNIFYEDHSIKYQINPIQQKSFKGYDDIEIFRGDKVLWAHSSTWLAEGEVIDIFPDKIRIKENENEFNLSLDDFTFVKL